MSGDNFWAFAVAEGRAELSAVATHAGDQTCQELLAVRSAFYGTVEPDAFFAEMITNRRLVIRIDFHHIYGIIATEGRRPRPALGASG